MDMNRKKKVKALKSAYQSMDEERKEKIELIAKSLLNVQVLVDEKRPRSLEKKEISKNGG
jgi:hypothetical protein